MPQADSYVLEEATDPGFTNDPLQIYSGPNTWHEINSRGIRRYHYRVKAHGNSGDSSWSNTQWVDVRWEEEPNGSIGMAQGPLVLGLATYGWPNDAEDIFWFSSSTNGPISVNLTNHTGIGTQLLLYYDYGQPQGPTEVAKAYQPPYDLRYAGLKGRYYIRIYTQSGFDTSTVYTLRTSFP